MLLTKARLGFSEDPLKTAANVSSSNEDSSDNIPTACSASGEHSGMGNKSLCLSGRAPESCTGDQTRGQCSAVRDQGPFAEGPPTWALATRTIPLPVDSFQFKMNRVEASSRYPFERPPRMKPWKWFPTKKYETRLFKRHVPYLDIQACH